MTRITHAAVNALKEAGEAEKIYLVTMCSGTSSHIQLIPRRKGGMIVGRVFASARGVLTNYEVTRAVLEEAMRRWVENYAMASLASR